VPLLFGDAVIGVAHNRGENKSMNRSARIMSALASSLVLVSPVALAAPAQASVQTQCTGQDRVIIKRVENVSNKFTVTKIRAITLAAGSGWDQTTTLQNSHTLTASATYTSEVGGSAKWAFAQLDAKVSISLKGEGSTTGTKSVSEKFYIPPASKARHFALFQGWHSVTGRWHYLSCSRAPHHGVEKFGPVKSYGAYDSGTVLCPRSRYASSDYRYKVAVAAGC